MVKFIDDRYFKVNGNTEGEFEPSRQGCYVSVFVHPDEGEGEGKLFDKDPLAHNYKLICIARFGKYAGRAKGLAEAKRWLKAAFKVYATGTELYNALNPENGEHIAPGNLIPVPKPRQYTRKKYTFRPINAVRAEGAGPAHCRCRTGSFCPHTLEG